MRSQRLLCLVAFLVALIIAAGPGHARGLSSMSSGDIQALQQRLKDASCYQGDADGVASPALDAAIKACPSQDPILRIETGMHTAGIKHIAADAACRIAATSSEDKTVRVWSIPDGTLLYTQRLPIGDGNAGKVYAVGISPDGTLAAAGTYDGSLYVFDAATGQNLRRLATLPDLVHMLVFSADGQRIAAGLGGDSGVRVIDVASGRQVMSDPHFARYSYGLAFGPDGSLYATGENGYFRRYGPDGGLLANVATHGGKTPYSVAIDPAGRRLAVGFLDSKAVEFFDPATLRHVGFAETGDLKFGTFASLSWSQDGSLLFGGGDAQERFDTTPLNVIRRFRPNGRRYGKDVPVAINTVTDLGACGKQMIFSTGDPSFGLVQLDGTVGILSKGHSADMRNKLDDAFTVSDDGMRVRFGLTIGNGDPVLADLVGGRVTAAPQPIAGLMPADRNLAALHISGGFQFAPGDILRSAAIRPDRAGFMLGTTFFLMSIDQNVQLRWAKEGPGEAWGVNLAQGGDIVVAAYEDGTLRWKRWADGQELLALFVDKDDKRWVAWTPTGYYMASPGGEDLIGWHVNRGWSQPADFFPASRFRQRFNRPDIVRLVLKTRDEDAAINQANETARRKDDSQPLINELPPVIRIVDPVGGTHLSTGEVKIDYAWRSPSGLPVDRITVQINDRPAKEIGLPLRTPGKDTETKGSVQVALRDRNSTIGLIARSGERASQVAGVQVIWDGAPAASAQDRKLYAVIVGISTYAEADMTLGFAAKDAGDFAKALEAQKGGYYGDVETRLITDRAATRDSIIEGLEWLEQHVSGKDDVGVLFLAGHGITDEKQTYWFLPSDATEDNFRLKGVSQDEMRRTLQALPGKALWFLDTCHAGGAARRPVDINVLVNAVTAPENGGIITFASSTGNELSEERPDWHNGAFTKAIVEGIGDGQAGRRDGSITTYLLESFLETRVQDLTGGKQHPVMGRPPEEPDFTIAKVAPPH